jgi:6-hydroxycyclohex-1-ene-1-carbonyl-CoA dehydrogenase
MSINGYRWQMTAVGEPFVKQDCSFETPLAGEVTVEVAGCGVCHTDLGFLYDGVRTNHELPLTLGHEISGRVVACGAGAEGLLGKAVVIPAVMPCGECDLCRRGLGTLCRGQKMPGNDIQGGFASHITVPARGLCPVDEKQLEAAGMSLPEVAVLADAVTTPYQAALLAGINAGDLAIVIGVGGVGGYAVQIAHAMGAHVVAIDVDQAKLDQLKDFGAGLTLNAKEHDARAIKQLIKEHVKANGLRATEWRIFECSGSTPGQETAFSLLTYGSHLAVVGFTMAKLELRLSNLMAFSARLQGNWGCLPEYYPKALDLVLQNKIQMKPFVKLHSLNDINAVFEAAKGHLLTERAILVPNL